MLLRQGEERSIHFPSNKIRMCRMFTSLSGFVVDFHFSQVSTLYGIIRWPLYILYGTALYGTICKQNAVTGTLPDCD